MATRSVCVWYLVSIYRAVPAWAKCCLSCVGKAMRRPVVPGWTEKQTPTPFLCTTVRLLNFLAKAELEVFIGKKKLTYKHMKKLSLRGLYLMLLAFVLPMVAHADNVAKIGTTEYATLAEAVAAVPTDGTQTTITMIADETIVGNAGLTIAVGKNIVLDLNGKAVIGNTDSETTYALICNLGNLTIKDASDTNANGTGTGKLEVNPAKPWVYSEENPGGYASNLIRNEGTLMVESGNFMNNGQGSACYAIDNYSAGNVTINGGKVDAAKSSAVRLFYNNGGSVTVNGGVIGHYNSNSDYSYMGIQVQNGTNANVTVNGGTLDGYFALYTGNSGGSTNITGGTFDGYVGFGENTPNISISGGEFNAWVGAYGSQEHFISGGTFAAEPDEELLADGLVTGNDGSGNYYVTTPVAQIGTTKYATLEAAIADAQDGQTVTLLANCAGNGIKVAQGKFTTGLTVDFGGFTYTVDGETVGSTGTETNGFQLLKDNKITFKDGTITSEKAKILVQNYSNLTLEGMTLTLDNPNYTSAYTLSNNNGNVVIDGTTINANSAGGFAFDVCRYASYPSVYVTVTGESTINGNVEIFASGSDAKNGFGLTLTSGTIDGNIVVDATAATAMDATPEKVAVTKADGFTQAAPAGYKWEDNGDGTSTLVVDEFILRDGTAYTKTADEQVAKATYIRSFGSDRVKKYQGWFVPFDYTITAADLEKFRFFKINMIAHTPKEGETEDASKLWIHLIKMAEGDVLKANRPYIFTPIEESTDYEFTTTNATLKKVTTESVADCSTTTERFDFYGVYTSIQPTADNTDIFYYMAKSGEISYATKTTTKVGANRWIFRVTPKDGEKTSVDYSKSMSFGFVVNGEEDDDDLTAVSDATAAAEGEVVAYYTLSGQKVAQPTKGVYVVKYANGTSKKVVF